jgi:Bacteriophage probable baseplate hub protein
MTLAIEELEKAHQEFYVPAFRIKVNEQDLLEKLFLEIVSVQVDNPLKGPDHFSFTINNAFNFENREFRTDPEKPIQFPLISDLFAFGNSVEILMGYGTAMQLMLRGKITAVQTSFPAGGLPQINVSGFDLSYCMGKGKNSDSWTNKTDSYVATQLANKNGLEPKVTDTKVQHPKIEQNQESDWQFLRKLADRNGYELSVFDKDLKFAPPANNKEAVISLEWGRGLLSFSPEINIAEQISKVEVRGWDVASKKEIVGTASIGEEPGRDPNRRSGAEMVKQVCKEQGELKVRIPVFSQQEAKRRAEAILKKRSELFVQGSGESIGLPEIKANTNIELTGMGKPFNKTYYVEQSTHTINASGYRTTFKVKDTTI